MTACAIDTAAEQHGAAGCTGGSVRTGYPGGGYPVRAGLTISADGTYAARLAGQGDALFPERWTLDGPEPYAVPLPLDQPEEPDAEVLPLSDGRVLIRRRVASRFAFSLLYPTGPGTGELPLGAVESAELTLLPPSPDGMRAYALARGVRSTVIWLVAGGAFGPERVAEVPGRCTGGVWLDRTGRLLALDRQLDGGPVKAVAVDLARGGEVTPLLQITDESDDRLLLADPDSGLLLIRSNAPGPGQDRMCWGVLGSTRPARFPDCLRLPDAALTPFAVQPGQMLMPENCTVALRIDGPSGSGLGVWRPAERRLRQLPVPQGWLAGAGLVNRDGVVQLPYATPAAPCGVARVETAAAQPEPQPEAQRARQPAPQPASQPTRPPEPQPASQPAPQATPQPPPQTMPQTMPQAMTPTEPRPAPCPVPPPAPTGAPAERPLTHPAHPPQPAPQAVSAQPAPAAGAEAPGGACRPVPLQQAPLTTRATAG
ncbi:hypothetical protein [Streptomyces sp. MUM 178J]|uniref:hypothetical protein n=1 Tax=Streptomyces sp. MUM 178J TaxID=2791991 RepID=UPI001F03B94C|nr:hypothetical protein [Streptomyces sp. MUM 178J]WRQ79195.1 hypothetical protein I3F59_007295 [Streptomyces sp. MUM 178J]